MKIRTTLSGLCVCLLLCNGLVYAQSLDGWPEITAQMRPWAYNHWLGSAVDTENLDKELTRYQEGGLGGIHIIPIYGVKGEEKRNIEFLSPEWFAMLSHAISGARERGMDADMTTGTGWNFGGPNIPKALAGRDLKHKVHAVKEGETLTLKNPLEDIVAIMAYSGDGDLRDLTALVDAEGKLKWTAMNTDWTVYEVIAPDMKRMVKRAGPGGSGPMLNPYQAEAMQVYLERFTEAFNGYDGPLPRAMYHDSYEYSSRWSADMLAEFERRRGYKLQDQFPKFFGDPEKDETAARIRYDYKRTIAEMMLENVFPQWIEWCGSRGMQTRNQAHGGPGNMLDLYALSDIPETEMFGRGTRDPIASKFDEHFDEGDRNPLISKLSSSAAHVMDKQLVGAETGTWMAEHFCGTLEEMKCLVDLFFVSGVNHVIYHGCTYSPDDAEWPGWLFYASTQMNPRNAFWRDVRALNDYIARAQSILQSGKPDNDVLLYWPIHDFWMQAPSLNANCNVHHREWFVDYPIGDAAQWLWEQGYGFDYASDLFLKEATVAEDGALVLPGGTYQVLVVPKAQYMTLETLHWLITLAGEGAKVIFQDTLPEDLPGYGGLSQRSAFKALRKELGLKELGVKLEVSTLGKGRFMLGALEEALAAAEVKPETFTDHAKLRFIRRKHDTGRHYFLANQSVAAVEGWVPLATKAASVVLMDPMTGESGGLPIRQTSEGYPEVFLNILPGHSVILRTFTATALKGKVWEWREAAEKSYGIEGTWDVQFFEGGPVLPEPFTQDKLASWTEQDDSEIQRFAGTARYTTTFDAPEGEGPWLLDLGEVKHSAKVRLNGEALGTVFMHPYRLTVDTLKATGNVLEVEATNLSMNRLRDLDHRGVVWRKFHDINFVSIKYEPFDASKWPLQESGLLGPVRLYKAEKITP